MTEAEWDVCEDPLVMLAFLRVSPESRNALLLTQACMRRVQNVVSERCVAWGELFGQIAEQGTSLEQLNSEWESVESELNLLDVSEAGSNGGGKFYALLSILVAAWVDPTAWEAGNAACAHERKGHSAIVRDIFGNPFRPVVVNPLWFTSTVVALAEGIYQDRAFDRMPILADALQDAGCDNEDVLTHCRQPGEHVRGCWVVDLLTGRK